MSERRAVIFGITGQDGSYLAEWLIGDGYEVVGVSRRTSSPNDGRIQHLLSSPRLEVVPGDVTDAFSVVRVLERFNPDEVYNLAAMSHVGVSFGEPCHTWAATAGGALNVLEAIRSLRLRARFYQASSSEMFGQNWSYRNARGDRREGSGPFELAANGRMDGWCEPPFQNEDTPFSPNSPYAVAKLAAHHLCRIYRESYGIFACSGILFNHESERRGEAFVTRKVARYAAVYARDRERGKTGAKLRLGNLEASRDWGHAEDYVRAMMLMLRQGHPDDFVVATGETHSVRELVHAAFAAIGEGPLVADAAVETDPSLFRPCEVPFLRGDASQARKRLGWAPQVTFAGLVRRMVLSEIARTQGE